MSYAAEAYAELSTGVVRSRGVQLQGSERPCLCGSSWTSPSCDERPRWTLALSQPWLMLSPALLQWWSPQSRSSVSAALHKFPIAPLDDWALHARLLSCWYATKAKRRTSRSVCMLSAPLLQ